MDNQSEKTLVRISFLGAEGVGKTALFNYFTKKQKTSDNAKTLHFESAYTQISQFRIQWNDIPGTPKFPNGTPLRNDFASRQLVGKRNIIVLTYDITNRESFQELRQIQQEFEWQCQPPTRLILVGTKKDLKADRTVSEKDAEDYAAQYGMAYFEVSTQDPTTLQPLQAYLDKCVKEHSQRIEEYNADQSKQELKRKIQAFRDKYPENEDIEGIANVLDIALEKGFNHIIQFQIKGYLWRLQQTSKSIFNSVVNMCASLVREIYYLRQTLGLTPKPTQIEKNSFFMFFGEKQEAQSLIEAVEDFKKGLPGI